MKQSKIAFASLLIVGSITSAFAQVTKAERDGSAHLVTDCVMSKAPANWESITVTLDRTNPIHPVLSNQAKIKDSKDLVDIDTNACDTKKQADDLAQFQLVAPVKLQKIWQKIILNVTNKGVYEVSMVHDDGKK